MKQGIKGLEAFSVRVTRNNSVINRGLQLHLKMHNLRNRCTVWREKQEGSFK